MLDSTRRTYFVVLIFCFVSLVGCNEHPCESDKSRLAEKAFRKLFPSRDYADIELVSAHWLGEIKNKEFSDYGVVYCEYTWGHPHSKHGAARLLFCDTTGTLIGDHFLFRYLDISKCKVESNQLVLFSEDGTEERVSLNKNQFQLQNSRIIGPHTSRQDLQTQNKSLRKANPTPSPPPNEREK